MVEGDKLTFLARDVPSLGWRSYGLVAGTAAAVWGPGSRRDGGELVLQRDCGSVAGRRGQLDRREGFGTRGPQGARQRTAGVRGVPGSPALRRGSVASDPVGSGRRVGCGAGEGVHAGWTARQPGDQPRRGRRDLLRGGRHAVRRSRPGRVHHADPGPRAVGPPGPREVPRRRTGRAAAERGSRRGRRPRLRTDRRRQRRRALDPRQPGQHVVRPRHHRAGGPAGCRRQPGGHPPPRHRRDRGPRRLRARRRPRPGRSPGPSRRDRHHVIGGWLSLRPPQGRLQPPRPPHPDRRSSALDCGARRHAASFGARSTRRGGAVFVPPRTPLAEVWQPNADVRDVRAIPAVVLPTAEAVAAAVVELGQARISATVVATAWSRSSRIGPSHC